MGHDDPSGQGRIPVLDIGAYLAGEAGAALWAYASGPKLS